MIVSITFEFGMFRTVSKFQIFLTKKEHVMKYTLIFAFMVICTIPSQAQWVQVGGGGASQILAFGVHDTSLFAAEQPIFGWDPLILRFRSYTPNPPFGHWLDGNDSGIDRTQGNITSFAEIPPFFVA